MADIAKRDRQEVWLERERLKGRIDTELRRVERQRTLFTMLPPGHAKDAFQAAMLARARMFLEAGRCDEASAVLEFLPSAKADRLIDDVIGNPAARGETS